MAGEIKVDLSELKALPAKLYAVSVKAAEKALARSLKETIRATRKAAIQATRSANVVKLTATELRAGASEKLSKKRPADGADYEFRARSKGGFPFFGGQLSGPGTKIEDAFALFRVSDFKINLFRFFARRVRVITRNRITPNLTPKGEPTFRTFKPKTYGARVRVMGKSYVAGRGFIVKRGNAGVIMVRDPASPRSLRKPFGRKLWGPSMVRITDGTNVNRAAATAGLAAFAKSIIRNLNFYASKSKG